MFGTLRFFFTDNNRVFLKLRVFTDKHKGFFIRVHVGTTDFWHENHEMMIFWCYQKEGAPNAKMRYILYKWFDYSKSLLVFLNIKKIQEVTFLSVKLPKKKNKSAMVFLVGCWVPTSPIRPSGHELHVILTVVPCAVIPCNFHGIAVALRGAFLEVGDKSLVKPEFRCKLQKLRDSNGLKSFFLDLLTICSLP